MRLNGFSYKGCYHPENQDAFLCIRGENDRFAMAVSDGLGSKKKSARGAAAFCRSVERLFRAGDALWAEQIPAVLHGMWLEELGDAAPDECNATGLFALWQGGVFTLGALGDGIAAAQMIDGQTMVLFDAKEEYFLNETDCLGSEHCTEKWRVRQTTQRPETVLLCTDGIEISPGTEETIGRFIREMTQSYAGMDAKAIQADVRIWVSDWPGADDKTIAYYLSEPVVQGIEE